MRLLTPEQVADLLSIRREQVIKRARAGKIPALKIGKCYRFRLEAIERWIEEQEQSRATPKDRAPEQASRRRK
jgi:excisionase family DNA binding protein